MASPTLTKEHYRRPFIRWIDVKEQLTGYLFILPAVVIITMFGLFPIAYAFFMSLHNWRLGKTDQVFTAEANYIKAIGDWTGLGLFVIGILFLAVAYWLWSTAFRSLKNRELVLKVVAALLLVPAGLTLSLGWERMVSAGDKNFLESLPITLYYSLGTVPAEIILAMVLAYILFQKIRGKEFFRMIYFLPYITPAVATAVVFRSMFSPRSTALVNKVLDYVGIEPQKWLFESRPFLNAFFGLNLEPGFLTGPSMALVSIIIFGIWTYVGYNTVIFLAGLGSIPQELYEAAEIDGAGQLQLFRYITLPLLSPVTFYLALIAFIGTFKAFNHIYVMREAYAQGTVDVTSVFIFDTFYRRNLYGYATAQAIILFFIILGLTYAQNKIMGEKVFYG